MGTGGCPCAGVSLPERGSLARHGPARPGRPQAVPAVKGGRRCLTEPPRAPWPHITPAQSAALRQRPVLSPLAGLDRVMLGGPSPPSRPGDPALGAAVGPHAKAGGSVLLHAQKMGEKLLGLCVDKMAASPANKMAAPRTGLQGDKGAVGSDLSCLTGKRRVTVGGTWAFHRSQFLF